MRRAVFHFHLFKNAGSSVDRILRDSFPNAWQEKEFRFTKDHWPYEEIEQWIAETSDIKAYSSHTARLPLPRVKNVELFPVIFVRHPLIRLYSAYQYERAQDAETPGAKKAKETDFKAYLEWRFTRPRDASAKNFQSNRLSHLFRPERGHLIEKRDLESAALKAIETLPFIGFVEKFEDSMKSLKRILSRKGLDLTATLARENVGTSSKKPTAERIADIQTMIGDEVYEQFCAFNSVDLKLYDRVASWYA
ncbi:MAG: sulfotransferase family 2 domain-containing protein [Hellea sp.]|nr:sulfotransferase family 2 domain-containing protein [Hellea sp.]